MNIGRPAAVHGVADGRVLGELVLQIRDRPGAADEQDGISVVQAATSSGVSSSRPLIWKLVDQEPDRPFVWPWVLVSMVALPSASEMYLWVLASLPPR